MNTARQVSDDRAVLIGILESKIDRGLLTISEALGKAYDAGNAADALPPTVRARTLKELIAAAGKASSR